MRLLLADITRQSCVHIRHVQTAYIPSTGGNYGEQKPLPRSPLQLEDASQRRRQVQRDARALPRSLVSQAREGFGEFAYMESSWLQPGIRGYYWDMHVTKLSDIVRVASQGINAGVSLLLPVC